MPARFTIVFLLICVKLSTVSGQMIPGLVKDKVHVKGFVSATGIGYGVNGIESRRDPFYWALAGNLNVKVGELVLPFSVTYNAQEAKFERPQPFNQFGVSPRYKWITTHMGYRTVQFSELTLGGNMFLGGGVELTPNRFPLEFRAIYGRFSRAINPSNRNFYNSLPSYERWGYGSKVTLKKGDHLVDLILFKAKDDKYSLSDSVAAASGVAPGENLVTGLNYKTLILNKRIVLDFQYAFSAYTRDIRSEEVVLDAFTYYNNLGGLYTPRSSSQFNGAFIGKVGYRGNSFQGDISFRKIDPEYRTMGSTFLNNDLRDITINLAKPFFQNKLQLNGGAGVQQNNLDKSKEFQMVRLIGNANCTYSPSSYFSLNINYANFSTKTTHSTFSDKTIDQIDSLFYMQVTNNAGFSINCNPAKDLPWTNLMLQVNYQKAKDNNSGNSEFYNISIGDQMTFPKQKLNVNAGFNLSKNSVSTLNSLMLGPATSVVKTFKEVRFVFSSAWQNAFTNENLKSRLFNTKLVCQYTYQKKHVLGIDFSFLSRQGLDAKAPSFQEWRGGLNYRYTFDLL